VAPDPSRLLRLLFWETTTRCNLSCAHCRRLETNDSAGNDISTAQARTMIEQLAGLGKKQGFMPILVFSGGEPLCRKDLFELIAFADSCGLVLALATNGTLIDETTAGLIKDNGIHRVSVSLDGATSEVHNKLRQQEGSFESAIEGTKNLVSKNVPFQINVTITKYNSHQIEDIYTLAKLLGAVALHTFMLVPVGCGQQFDPQDMLNSQEYEDMMIKIAELDSRGDIQVKVTCGPHYERVIREQGLSKSRSTAMPENAHPGISGKGHPGGSSRGCLAGTGVLFVGHQGDVFPCGYLPVNCGNILKSSLEDIWEGSEDLARMRNVNELQGKCGACGYRKVCGGCRARAYAATGNYMAAEPFCMYVPPGFGQ